MTLSWYELCILTQFVSLIIQVLFDTQKSCVGGLNDELIYSARLDNLEMSFCSAMALIHSVESPSTLENESSIRMISLFDHEEIGSTSTQGAQSNLLSSVIRRLSVLPAKGQKSPQTNTAYEQTLSTSFLISADMGMHAIQAILYQSLIMASTFRKS